MKNLLPKALALFLLLFAANHLFAQDKIYKKNEEVILCKVTEIGEEEIKFTKEESGELVYVLDKAKIEKIVLENGKELVFARKMTDPELYTDQNKNAFKIGLFSPMTGALSLSYERSLKPGKSIEGTLGLIGLGRDNSDKNPAGGYLKAGYKFIMTPDFEMRGMRYSHLLKGFYFKPELNFAYYGRDFVTYNYNYVQQTTRGSVVAGALTLSFGKQWVMSNVFLVDMFVGFGYGFDSYKTNSTSSNSEYYNNEGYHYGFIVTPDLPIAFTSGFKVGFLTK
tara:strand:+ start:166184 stop:167023 length:840 start_codon:yes stop_codon:yes gene_type:complete